MKMSGLFLLLLLGFGVCAFLIRRHAQRKATPPESRAQQSDNLRPVNAWQEGIKLAPPVKLDWREQLRREEEKQRPWEGRN